MIKIYIKTGQQNYLQPPHQNHQNNNKKQNKNTMINQRALYGRRSMLHFSSPPFQTKMNPDSPEANVIYSSIFSFTL